MQTDLEKRILDDCGAAHLLCFNSKSAALLAAFEALDLSQDDEILLNPVDDPCSVQSVHLFGLKPRFYDVTLEGSPDTRLLERFICAQTKAIIINHFSGNKSDIEKISEIARKHHLLILNDAFLAFESHEKKSTFLCDITLFGFSNFSLSEAACLVTQDSRYAQKLKRFQSLGIEKKQFWNQDLLQKGLDVSLSPILAAHINEDFENLEASYRHRREIAKIYDQHFQNNKLFSILKPAKDTHSSYAFYPLFLSPALHCPKEDIYQELRDKKVTTAVHYKPVYKYSFFEKLLGKQSLFGAEDFYRSELSVPCDDTISHTKANSIAETVLEVITGYSYRGCSF